MSDKDSGKTMGTFSYKQVNKENIPEIINFLSSKTDNFKIPLKTLSAIHKTETAFGEINTDYIVESTNENNEIYYVFSIIPDVSDSQTYNLEIKSDGTTPESVKLIVYYPIEDWLLNGNVDFSIFSGRAYTYSLDGNLETSVDYQRGAAGPCDPNPCPDCPPNQGPGGGTTGGGGGGYPPGQGPGTGNPPTGTGGPISYLPNTPNPPNNPPQPPSEPGGTGGGAWAFHCEYDLETGGLKCFYIWVATNQTKLINPCGGAGVIISTQDTPCKKTQKMLNNTKTKPAIDALKAQAPLGGEKGVKIKADGTPSPLIDGGSHSVNLGDKTGYQGGYHNHTPTGIPMLSPPDIEQLLGFARAQGNTGTPSNAYIGMVAPNSMHYVVRFSGSYNDAMVGFSQEQIEQFIDDYKEISSLLSDNSLYSNNYLDLNNTGLEKLFFRMIKEMGLDGKVILHK